jgi:cyclopropane-fatty-acyl-phospholipid synthase
MFRPLEALLDRVIRHGRLTIIDAGGKAHLFGDGAGEPVTVRLADRGVEWRIALDPQLAVGEAYMLGRLILVEGQLYDFLALIARNIGTGGMPFARPIDLGRAVFRRLAQFNPVGRSRRNVAHHYDIDSRVYGLFLDSDRQYSCAYFEPGADLESAQRAKKRHIAAKLRLAAGHRVLDIGCGWGGLALYLAEAAGCDVTGITLSEEQLRIARERAWRQSRPRTVRFELQDYRKVEGPFDRIVSVGMFEHVGVNHYRTFFRRVSELLTDDGVAVLHSIGRADGPGYTNPFIAKYIFPGGYFPALSEVVPAIERSGLYATDIEILRLHYAETLRAWRERFLAGRQQAVALKGEAFARMWEFYLAGAEAAFRYSGLIVFQIQLAKRVDTLPITRDYMYDTERLLTERGEPPRMAGE